MNQGTPKTAALELEFQIVAIRCKQCGHTGQTPHELAANLFMLVHGLHKGLVYQAKVTAPPEHVDGRIMELEFAPAVTQ